MKLLRRFASLFRKTKLDADLSEELRLHVEQRTRENIAAGMSADEARYAAFRKFGGVEQVKERVREQRVGRWLANCGQDLRYGARSLRKTPGFTAVALLTLALGIGANTAIFSLIKSVLLRPLPYPQQEQLVLLWENLINFDRAFIAWPDLQDWRRENTTFSAIGGFRRENFTLTGGGEPEMLRGARITASFFEVIGLPALRGRVFNAEEDKPGQPGLVLLGHALWQRNFAGRDDVLGKILTLNGEPHIVIGVLPPEFHGAADFDFWTQLGRISDQPGFQNRGNHPGIFAIGRMKPGQTFETAIADLKRIAVRIEKANPDSSKGVTASGQSLFENVVGSYRHGLWLLLGAVALVLLIACANLANLLLARNASRAAELAVRAALGASRGRIVRQLLGETLLLSLGGGAIGIALAAAAQRGIVALAPTGIPRFQQGQIDLGVLAASFVLAGATALICGLWPAWKSARPDLRSALQSGGRTGGDGPGAARAREMLIVAEIALTLVLLVGAGLLLRSFARAQSANLGFDAANVFSVRLALQPRIYDSEEKRRAFGERVLERVRALPGVESADLATNSPLNTGWQTLFIIDGRPDPGPGQRPLAEMNIVSDDYFRTLRIPVLRGRAFASEDTPSSLPSVIVDQAFAERFFPGQEALGQKVNLGGERRVTIVGLVPTLKVYGYSAEPRMAQMYLSSRQTGPGNLMLLVRAGHNAGALTTAVRRAVLDIDSRQPVFEPGLLEERIDRTFATPRLYSYLLTIFAGVALLLAAVGLYGVVAFQVNRRTREFGIRIALGALRSQVMTHVLRRGLRLLALGAGLGLVGALALGRILGALLYQTSAMDPVVFGSVTALLAVIALVACWLPARRAMKVNPMIALRAE
jgi:putative ABC transport system permease protein